MSCRIVVVGGVAGGMSAATRARRTDEQAQITVLEQGEHVSFANCGLPYFIKGDIVEEESLFLTTPAKVRERFNVDVRVWHRVETIDRANKIVHGIDGSTGQPFSIPYDKLILSPGASPIVPSLAGMDSENVFCLRTVEDAQRLRDYLAEQSPRRAVVIGAGFIGLEMVESLHAKGLLVTVLEKAPHLLPALDPEMAGWLEQEAARHGVIVHLGVGLGQVRVEAGRVTAIETEAGEWIETDLVLISMGVSPNLELAKQAGIGIGGKGGISVDSMMRTNDPDIYAVGDAVEVRHGVTGQPARIPLAGAANRHGRGAGEHAATGRSSPASPIMGTAVLRLFGLDVAMTGLSRTRALEAGHDAETVIIHPNHHAGYYPGAEMMHLELVYDRISGKVLGAQAIGPLGIDKRIDVIATAMHFGARVQDLSALDLCYAPQFSSAKDPVHYAAFVAENQSRGLVTAVDELRLDAQVLDVRTLQEREKDPLPGSVHIPVDNLRSRLAELDSGQQTVVVCHVGIRAYVAARILVQNGFKSVAILKGGYVQLALRQGIH